MSKSSDPELKQPFVDFSRGDAAERPSIQDSMEAVGKRYNFESVAVFMGSSKGVFAGTKDPNPLFEQEARKLGMLLAQNNMRLIYGGGNAGLMGTISEAVLDNGGSIHGVLSTAFVQDSTYRQQNDPNAFEEVVEGIEVRKWRMITKADACFAFPGGLGTLDELLEAAVEQYQRPYRGKPSLSKPIIVLNINGVFDGFYKFLDDAIDQGFARPVARNLFKFVGSVDEGFEHLLNLQGQPRITFDEIGNCERETGFAAKRRAQANDQNLG